MTIDLRKIRTNEALSEETNCYSADLYFEGKKIGTVGNHGHGGPDFFHGDQAAFERAEAWAKALPPLKSEYFPEGLEQSVELVCGELVEHHKAEGYIKRRLGKKAMYMLPARAGEVRETWIKGKQPDEALYQSIRERHPAAIILNLLPLDQAVAHYRGKA